MTSSSLLGVLDQFCNTLVISFNYLTNGGFNLFRLNLAEER